MPKSTTFHRPAPVNRSPRNAANFGSPFGKKGGKAPKPAPEANRPPFLNPPGARPPKG